MRMSFTEEDKRSIEDSIRRKFAKVACTPQGLFKYPTGRAGLESLKYESSIVGTLPKTAVDSYCGVGNPFSLGSIHEGESVLDVGCGGGLDSMVAATMVGPKGRVFGIDVSPEMLERAKKNLSETFLGNVSIQEASASHLPFPDCSFDVVISNGVINLVPDKTKAMAEVFRVLKPGGRLMIADQILEGQLPADAKARVDNWAG
jgi:arsenite methyltransferase